MPAVASGGSTVPSTLCKISKARGSGFLISTGMGLSGAFSSRPGARSGALGHWTCPLADLVFEPLQRARDVVEGAGRFRRFAQG